RSALMGLVQFSADRAIVTVPLGVLQAKDGEPGAIRFHPEPSELRGTLERLEMGQAIRITLALRRDFWAEQQQLSQAAFIHSDDPFLPTWWTSLDSAASLLTADSSKALTGWAGGPKAESLSRLSDAELADRAIQSLARILSVKREAIEARLVRWYVHNWSKDQFARGAYSYARVGGLEARRLLAA